MLFNSWEFLVFFPLVTAAYWALPHRRRWSLLLVASCYFYMVFVPSYILILFLLIGVDYAAGLLIEGASGKRRRWILAASLVANVGVLGLFKYANFATENLAHLLRLLHLPAALPHLDLLLPIGLSFHTFQSMAYTIEVYRGNHRAERYLGVYALYVLFYPQMVAGPIERPQNLLPQLHAPAAFDPDRFAAGLSLMLWGLFKKAAIADPLALLVEPVYASPATHSGWDVLLATYAFAIQIFCDFSGYSDIARGAAETMGLRLMLNFDQPYQASSVGEFWRRWHISLSSWFRDYLYVPLGGSRHGTGRTFRNMFVVFLVSGLWHGASWAFLVWGFLHGVYVTAGFLTRRVRDRVAAATGLASRPRLRALFGTFVTFHLVALAWVFFRAASIRKAAELLSRLGHLSGPVRLTGLDRFEWTGLVLALLVMEGVHLWRRRMPVRPVIRAWPLPARLLTYGGCVLFVLVFGRFRSQGFIYFQF